MIIRNASPLSPTESSNLRDCICLGSPKKQYSSEVEPTGGGVSVLKIDLL
jgi:hypothetical protein